MRAETASRLAAQMAVVGADVLALAPTDSFRYVAGFSPFPDERLCVLLLAAGKQALVVPSINAEDVRRKAQGVPLFEWKDGEDPEGALGRAISEIGLSRDVTIAVDPEMRADAALALQRAVPEARLVDGAAVLRPVREVKTARELDLLISSANTADMAMKSALEACRPGATEADVAASAVEGFRGAGVDSVSFTIIASGPNGAFPHHHTGDRELSAGDAVVIDLGAKLEHYSSDLTRMAYLGEPSPRYTEVHAVVERALSAALEAVRPGVTCGAIDDAARTTIEAAGFGDFFVHRTGHGLGLSMHEPPWIVPGSGEAVAEGMVFSIEPGIYLPGELGVRLEEIVSVTADGCQILSDLPRTLHVL